MKRFRECHPKISHFSIRNIGAEGHWEKSDTNNSYPSPLHQKDRRTSETMPVCYQSRACTEQSMHHTSHYYPLVSTLYLPSDNLLLPEAGESWKSILNSLYELLGKKYDWLFKATEFVYSTWSCNSYSSFITCSLIEAFHVLLLH